MDSSLQSLKMVSVVVPCYRHAEELSGCLTALAAQVTEVPYEILVVDSGNDPEVREVAQRFPKVAVVFSTDRLYCGAAKHRGALESAGVYLAFTDADCLPEPDWVDRAHHYMSKGHLMVGGPVMDGLPENLLAVCDNTLQFADVQPGRPAERIQHIPGCNLVVQKDAYLETGGFPALNSGDDVTLTTKFNHIYGSGIHFAPDLRVKHLGRTNLGLYLRHHHSFGKIRGFRGLHLKLWQQRLGRFWGMVPGTIIKRFIYIQGQTLKYNHRKFLFNTLLAPLLLLGLTAYAAGFRLGCQQAYQISTEEMNE